MTQQLIQDKSFGGERPLFGSRHVTLDHVVIHPGESALKQCDHVEAVHCEFNGKYPFWHNTDLLIRDCVFREGGRAAIWYSNGVRMEDTLVEAPKMFRDMENLKLLRVRMTCAQETLWNCRHVSLTDAVVHQGDYLFMHGRHIRAERLELHGNYSFQYCRDVEICDSVLHSKDAFWNTEDVTVRNSFLDGEYLGWHSRNLRLINCRIAGTQSLCYAHNLVLENCTFDDDADLCFEYSTVEADIAGRIHSIKNPGKGRIVADEIGEVVLDSYCPDPGGCHIEIRGGDER